MKNFKMRLRRRAVHKNAQIKEAVKKYHALIKNDSQYNDEDGVSRRINIRIPNGNFDAFIADISKGVHYFDLKNISSDDVTEEYTYASTV